jgi:hypothetical protein
VRWAVREGSLTRLASAAGTVATRGPRPRTRSTSAASQLSPLVPCILSGNPSLPPAGSRTNRCCARARLACCPPPVLSRRGKARGSRRARPSQARPSHPSSLGLTPLCEPGTSVAPPAVAAGEAAFFRRISLPTHRPEIGSFVFRSSDETPHLGSDQPISDQSDHGRLPVVGSAAWGRQEHPAVQL